MIIIIVALTYQSNQYSILSYQTFNRQPHNFTLVVLGYISIGSGTVCPYMCVCMYNVCTPLGDPWVCHVYYGAIGTLGVCPYMYMCMYVHHWVTHGYAMYTMVL